MGKNKSSKKSERVKSKKDKNVRKFSKNSGKNPGDENQRNLGDKRPDKGKTGLKKDFSEVNIKKFKTLENYKLYISRICTQAITYPESELKNVNLLYNIINKKGGGTEQLLEHVKKLAILSLGSVICHLLPRISHELNEVDSEVVKRTESAQSAKIIGQEREITHKTIELRDAFIAYIKENLPENPTLFLPLVSRLVDSDNRVCDELFSLCLKNSKISESCLNSIKRLFSYGSILDVYRYLKFIFKSPHVNYKVVRLINEIEVNKKQHQFILSEQCLNTDDKAENKKRTMRENRNFNLVEACIEGLGKYGLILEESLQIEILLELKSLLNGYLEKDVKKYTLVISGINSAVKLVKLVNNFEYNWIYELFTQLSMNITPLLFQGEMITKSTDETEQNPLFFSRPCVTVKYLSCLENVSNLLLKSNITADFQVITNLVQVNEIINKMSKLEPILSKEGIIFSSLAKGKSSYRELELLKSHYSPLINSSLHKSKDLNSILLQTKPPNIHLDEKRVDLSKYYNYSGLEVYQVLFSPNILEGLKSVK